MIEIGSFYKFIISKEDFQMENTINIGEIISDDINELLQKNENNSVKNEAVIYGQLMRIFRMLCYQKRWSTIPMAVKFA